MAPMENEIAIRALTPEDAPRLTELVDGNRERLGEYFDWVEHSRTEQDALHFIEMVDTIPSFVSFAITFNGMLVGTVGMRDIDEMHKAAKIGYWIGVEFEGRGIATRATELLIHYAFNTLNLHRLQIDVMESNRKSQKIPERLGFTREGIARGSYFLKGKHWDMIQYSLIKE